VAPAGSTLDADEVRALKVETVKEYAKKLAKVDSDSPKMYGFIMQHLSVESKDEIAREQDYEVWSKALDAEKLWLAIVKTHKVDCVSNVSKVKELTARKAYQGIRQGAYESLAQYSERFCNTLCGFEEIGTTANPVGISEKEQAMDFFHGLDQGKYRAFKAEMMNGCNSKDLKRDIQNGRQLGENKYTY
jgi:hypothetical protein